MRDCEVFAKEILQKYKARVYIMASAPLADEVVNELKVRGHAPVLVKLPSAQYIAVTTRAKKKLARLLERKATKLQEELVELEKYQKEVEQSI